MGGCTFEKDEQGPGGIFWIDPEFDAGIGELWDVGELCSRLIPLRAEILAGDLRPLYLAFLGVSFDYANDDEENPEAPVPAGLGQLTDAQSALVELLSISLDLVDAAADKSPPLSAREDSAATYSAWLREQPQSIKDQWLTCWMQDAGLTARADMLDEFRKGQFTSLWPTVQSDRTLDDLQAAADQMQQRRDDQAAAKNARERVERLAEIAENLHRYLDEAEDILAARRHSQYSRAAKMLAESREAAQGTAKADLAEQHLQKLLTKYAKRSAFIAELRKHGLVPNQ